MLENSAIGWTTRDGAGCSNIGDEEPDDAGNQPDDNIGNSGTRDLDAGVLVNGLPGSLGIANRSSRGVVAVG